MPSTHDTKSVRSKTRRTQSHGSKSRRKCLRPGPIVRNPYLNFLRDFRKKCCGMDAVTTIKQGAKAWRTLNREDKLRYIEQAFYAPRRRMSKLLNRMGTRRPARRMSRGKPRLARRISRGSRRPASRMSSKKRSRATRMSMSMRRSSSRRISTKRSSRSPKKASKSRDMCNL